MFLSFCSALFSSPVSIQWLCLFLTIPLFRFNPSDVYRATLKWSRVFDLPDNSYHTKKKMTLWQILKLSKKFNLVNFFFRSRIAELCFSDAWQFTNYRETIISSLIHIGFVIFVWLQKMAVLYIFLQHPIEFRTGECLHGTTWSVRPTYKSEIFGCEALSSYPTRHVN